MRAATDNYNFAIYNFVSLNEIVSTAEMM